MESSLAFKVLIDKELIGEYYCAMDFDRWSGIIQKIEAAAHPGEQDFHPLDGVGGDRHGSMEVTYYRHPSTEDLTQFTSFAVTEGETEIVASISGGADNGRKFHRLGDQVLTYGNLGELEVDIELILAPTLQRTMLRASRLVWTDLDMQR